MRKLWTAIFGAFLGSQLIAEVAQDEFKIHELAQEFEIFQECAQCPEMIVIPKGSFLIGAKKGESRNPFDAYGPNPTFRLLKPHEENNIPQEFPRHKVSFEAPFAIGRNEITFKEWMECVNAQACTHVPEHIALFPNGTEQLLGPNHPVTDVSFLDVQEYVAWLNSLVGSSVYRLPTEAEWEYAVRSGTETRFAQGDDLTKEQANFSRRGTEQLRRKPMPSLVNRNAPVPVNELDAANNWGVRHMSGNVGEMTMSCWTRAHQGFKSNQDFLKYFYQNPSCNVVSKGGQYSSGMDLLRLAMRGQVRQSWRWKALGFRVVRIEN